MAELLVEIVEGPEAGLKVDLEGALEVGRGAGLGLALEGDGQVSRRHARIEPSADGALLTDLGSRNGTYVNDQPVHGPRQVSPGDRIRVGLTVLELRSARQLAERPSAVVPAPQVTQVGAGVLQPASAEELRGSGVFSAEELREAGVSAPAADPSASGIAAREALGATPESARRSVEASGVHPAAPPPFSPGGGGQAPPAAQAAPAAPPRFAPGGGAGEEPVADDAYAALAALVDTRVKRRTNIAVFAILATAGLAVLIYLGAS